MCYCGKKHVQAPAWASCVCQHACIAAQDRPTVSTKLVIACSSESSAAARAVAGSPLGRGRVALLCANRQVMSEMYNIRKAIPATAMP